MLNTTNSVNKHVHRIGIDCDSRGFKLFCVECKLHMKPLDVMSYLERLLGMSAGIEYWRKLRYERERMRIDKRKGILCRGFWMPE